ncbi:MAG: carbamoyl-phosphate synthase large subunit [bacterium]|nr:carbamoyl-phosphate synthase large subunit [bacterium]
MRTVMVLGSGPIVIGQAAEFDYAGSQACRTLKEEGLRVVLLNSNPATIMTDSEFADRVYLEPLNAEVASAILREERPQGVLPTLGGQVGLNLAVQLAEAGILDELGVALLGTAVQTIRRAEDREEFRALLGELGEPCPLSTAVRSVAGALAFAGEAGFPLVVRPAYTLGGTGSGVARNLDELGAVVAQGLVQSPVGQCLVEQYLEGWREIEFEVVRDRRDNCVAVCGMENLDPMGIHTGDSVVVAPCQTLGDREYQVLRAAAFRIVRGLGVEGACNVQFALEPRGSRYQVIEVNPRVSRSSALASKATGYPIAAVATRVALGYSLDEIAGLAGTACSEPVIDYVVAKVPRWPFDKFARADRRLGTQMKATGEVMGIDRTVEGALLKAVRSLEMGGPGLFRPELTGWSESRLREVLARPDDRRLFLLAEACRRGLGEEDLAGLTGIHPYFIRRLGLLAGMAAEVAGGDLLADAGLMRRVKRAGFADRELACLAGKTEDEVEGARLALGIKPVYKMVDTCAGEHATGAPCYYSTYEEEDEAPRGEEPSVLVIGSGPIRIGQGIEFDYCSVHAAWALREAGVRSLVINNNPETVSTDYTTSDRLFFEPVTREEVLDLVQGQAPRGVMVQFGGQTAINLASTLDRAGVRVLGTQPRDIDRAEDRASFEELLAELGVARPPGKAVRSAGEALAAAGELGYPVVVRPSYVLGGRAMEVVHDPAELEALAGEVDWSHPVLVDRFIWGREVEADAIADGEQVLVLGIMEHIEGTGIHSGDSLSVYPPRSLDRATRRRLVDLTTRLALALKVKGLVNVQYVLAGGEVLVLEANPRASRTVPLLSKVTGLAAVRVATRIALGETLAGMGLPAGLWPEPVYVAVKAPVFSWAKLPGVDTGLGPEMKSTGEVLGLDYYFAGAMARALEAAGCRLPRPGGTVAFSVADRDKVAATALAGEFARGGFELAATAGTAAALQEAGLPVRAYRKLAEGSPNLVEGIRAGDLDLVVNTLTRGKEPWRDGYQIRRAAVERGIPCFTALETAAAVLTAIRERRSGRAFPVRALQDYLQGTA